ncbi:hypothetical protein U1Q18_022654, partial [Sarracenia purpurea var. burkii]
RVKGCQVFRVKQSPTGESPTIFLVAISGTTPALESFFSILEPIEGFGCFFLGETFRGDEGAGSGSSLIGGGVFRQVSKMVEQRWFFCFTAKAKACVRHGKRRRVEIRGRDDDDRRIDNRPLT